MPRSFSRAEQEELQRLVARTRLVSIARRAAFPDWLGHLGLVLLFTRSAERSAPRISMALVPQFLELVEPGSEADSVLRRRLADERPMSIADLELVERDYNGPLASPRQS